MDIAVILHNIRSLHNVGSIFRTADAAGVKKIYLCGITPMPLDRFGKLRPQFAKVAMGAEKYVEWEQARGTASVIKKLRADGFKIFAVEQSKKSIPYSRFRGIRMRSQFRIALILGHERRGLPPSILKFADEILEIPMRGSKESLNVSVAFGVVIFHLIYSHGRVSAGGCPFEA
ncbi:MAG: RNA methyltransferase [Patescibacteria group bacterium]